MVPLEFVGLEKTCGAWRDTNGLPTQRCVGGDVTTDSGCDAFLKAEQAAGRDPKAYLSNSCIVCDTERCNTTEVLNDRLGPFVRGEPLPPAEDRDQSSGVRREFISLPITDPAPIPPIRLGPLVPANPCYLLNGTCVGWDNNPTGFGDGEAKLYPRRCYKSEGHPCEVQDNGGSPGPGMGAGTNVDLNQGILPSAYQQSLFLQHPTVVAGEKDKAYDCVNGYHGQAGNLDKCEIRGVYDATFPWRRITTVSSNDASQSFDTIGTDGSVNVRANANTNRAGTVPCVNVDAYPLLEDQLAYEVISAENGGDPFQTVKEPTDPLNTPYLASTWSLDEGVDGTDDSVFVDRSDEVNDFFVMPGQTNQRRKVKYRQKTDDYTLGGIVFDVIYPGLAGEPTISLRVAGGDAPQPQSIHEGGADLRGAFLILPSGSINFQEGTDGPESFQIGLCLPPLGLPGSVPGWTAVDGPNRHVRPGLGGSTGGLPCPFGGKAYGKNDAPGGEAHPKGVNRHINKWCTVFGQDVEEGREFRQNSNDQYRKYTAGAYNPEGRRFRQEASWLITPSLGSVTDDDSLCGFYIRPLMFPYYCIRRPPPSGDGTSGIREGLSVSLLPWLKDVDLTYLEKEVIAKQTAYDEAATAVVDASSQFSEGSVELSNADAMRLLAEQELSHADSAYRALVDKILRPVSEKDGSGFTKFEQDSVNKDCCWSFRTLPNVGPKTGVCTDRPEVPDSRCDPNNPRRERDFIPGRIVSIDKVLDTDRRGPDPGNTSSWLPLNAFQGQPGAGDSNPTHYSIDDSPNRKHWEQAFVGGAVTLSLDQIAAKCVERLWEACIIPVGRGTDSHKLLVGPGKDPQDPGGSEWAYSKFYDFEEGDPVDAAYGTRGCTRSLHNKGDLGTGIITETEGGGGPLVSWSYEESLSDEDKALIEEESQRFTPPQPIISAVPQVTDPDSSYAWKWYASGSPEDSDEC